MESEALADEYAEAEALIGRRVYDRDNDRTFTVREVDSKDGWPTISGGTEEPYWARVDDVEVLPEITGRSFWLNPYPKQSS